MADDRGIRAALSGAGRGIAACVAGVCALLVPFRDAGAQSGFLQVQYERSEAEALLFLNDSTVVPVSSIRSYWTQNYQMNQALLPGPNTSLTWQLGFQDRQAVDRVERTQTPYGNVRLTRPTMGFYASVRPTTITNVQQLGLFPGAPFAGVPTEQVRQHVTQTVVSTYLADPRLPRVDASWTRDQRDQSGRAGRRFDDRRDLRLSKGFGGLSLRASYGDLARGTEALNTQPYQRNLGAGAGYDWVPRAGMNLKADYDFSSFDRRSTGGLQADTRTHRGTINGTWAQSRELSWNLFSWYQRSQQPLRGRADQDNGEGQLFLAWQPTRRARFQTGGQIRRVARGTATGSERVVLATAAYVGDVRPGWTTSLDMAQTMTWTSFGDPFGVTTAHVGSRARLAEGIQASFDVQGAVNNDTITTSRSVAQGSAGLVLIPLRSIQSTIRGSFYRVGSGFDQANSTSRTGELDLRWAPWQGLQFSGNLRRQVSGPAVRATSSTRTAYVRWIPGTMMQFNLNYSRNRFEDPRAVGSNQLRREREIVSLQGTWSLDRAKQLSGEVSVLDPNQSRESHAYNASFTWRFGR